MREPAATPVFRLGYLRRHGGGSGGDDHYILNIQVQESAGLGPSSALRTHFRLDAIKKTINSDQSSEA